MTDQLDPLPADALAMGSITGKTVQIDPLTSAPAIFVYQRTSAAFANHASTTHPRLQLRREPGGLKGNTPQQQAHRALFSDGVATYKTLSPAARAALQAEAKAAGYRGNLYAYFMAQFMRLNATP